MILRHNRDCQKKGYSEKSVGGGLLDSGAQQLPGLDMALGPEASGWQPGRVQNDKLQIGEKLKRAALAALLRISILAALTISQ